MAQHLDFTYDPKAFQTLPDLVAELHGWGQHYVSVCACVCLCVCVCARAGVLQWHGRRGGGVGREGGVKGARRCHTDCCPLVPAPSAPR